MKLASEKTLEELILEFSTVWEAYWNSSLGEGPTKKDLDTSFSNILTYIQKNSKKYESLL